MGALRRRGGGLAVAAALAASALLGAGCAGASQKRSSQSLNALAAVTARAAAGGFKMNVAVNEIVGTSGVSLLATGSFAARTQAGSMSIDMHSPSFGTGGSMRVVIAGGTIYERLPSDLASMIPGRRPWLSVQLSQMSQMSQLPGLNDFIRESLTFADPAQYASFLGAAAGTARDLGNSTVNGVPATHYQTQLTITKLLAKAPTPDPQAAKQLVRALRSRNSAANAPVDVWIDHSGDVRRIQTSVKGNYAGDPVTLSIIENITSYGRQPTPTAPNLNNTTDLFSLVQGSSSP